MGKNTWYFFEDVLVFYMDGMAHTDYDMTDCCDTLGKRCECGGWMHYQPVYGGYYYKCEKCLKEES